ncbi:MAG: Rrf2 family transcriptional regulator [Actinomycetota bacterium]|nr:Rrf2 family transcriptional regulator [Actinomycetota bacterium]
MNVVLSKRGDYVVRAAIVLARAFPLDEARKIREVVVASAIPTSFAPAVLSDLVRAGLALSRAGRSGGYRLSRSPSSITLLEVVEAGEGEIHSELCAMGNGPCHWSSVCPLHESWKGALNSFRAMLANSSLQEVADRDRRLEDGTYPIPVDSHRSHSIVIGDGALRG